MGVDAMEGGGDQQAYDLSVLRARVERLEFEVAELRAGPGRQIAPPPPPPPPPSVAAERIVPVLAQPGRNASMEDRLGSEWFSRIGVVALLVAMALFLKLAIDKQWLGPAGRVGCGLVGGTALIVWSERFRRQGLKAFSYALKAVGSGVLYLTLWAAFQIYHLLPDWAALAAMVLVTAWNAYMAWAQGAELLAVYALIGGLATPRLLSTGTNHETFLFTYLLAIDVATIALVRVKPWSKLLLGSFPATVGYFIAWYSGFSTPAELWPTACFLGMFGAVFGSVAVRSPGRAPLSTLLDSVLLPLGNAAFVSLGLYSILQDSGHHASVPWSMILLSAMYLGAMRLPQARVTAAVHLSLAVLFLTVAIPLKATGRGIVVCWLVEGAALLAAAARLHRSADAAVRRALRWLACGTLMVGFVSVLTMPAWFAAEDVRSAAFVNWRFGTGLIGMAAFASAVYVALRASESGEEARRPWLRIAAVSSVAFNLVTISAVVQEITAVWRSTAGDVDAALRKALAISAFLMVYGAEILAAGFWRRSALVRWQGLVLLVFTIGKTFLFDTRRLSEGYRVVSFLALGVLLMAVSFAYQRDWLGLRNSGASSKVPSDVP